MHLAKVGVAGSNPVVRSICSTDKNALRGALALFEEPVDTPSVKARK